MCVKKQALNQSKTQDAHVAIKLIVIGQYQFQVDDDWSITCRDALVRKTSCDATARKLALTKKCLLYILPPTPFKCQLVLSCRKLPKPKEAL